MTLPSFLIPYADKAEKILSNDEIHHIEFSQATYQIEIKCNNEDNKKKSYWVFIQLDSSGKIKDSFCSCQNDEENIDAIGCSHIAACYLRIFNGAAYPLHVRFSQSLWNKLCFIYCSKLGEDPDFLQSNEPNSYFSKSYSGKNIFLIKALSKSSQQMLCQILYDRPQETEETSLKFSNLTQEDLKLWRQGIPSIQLQYELSFWSDLAKWMMLQQDAGKEYNIEFEYNRNKLPNKISITFKELLVEFYLPLANLPEIIPSLAYVKSPLVVCNEQQNIIKSAIYDPYKETLTFLFEKSALKQQKNKLPSDVSSSPSITLDQWQYFPEKGFFSQLPLDLIKTPFVTAKHIDEALTSHENLLKNVLQDYSIYEDPIACSYTLHFDDAWNLIIETYAFEPGDITLPRSKVFGNWAFIQDDGFVRLTEKVFDAPLLVIKESQVAHFVMQNRLWLSKHEGFKTHSRNIEIDLTYQLNDDNRLVFQQKTNAKSQETRKHTFEKWTYYEGKGFFLNLSPVSQLSLRSGLSVSSVQIPLFIHMNIDELESIPNFFTQRSPIKKSYLEIRLTNANSITISPHYEIIDSLDSNKVKIFDDFSYIEGEGFSQLPSAVRLPEEYQQFTEITGKNLSEFLEFHLDDVLPFTEQIDSQLKQPTNLNLFAQSLTSTHEDDEQIKEHWFELLWRSEYGDVFVTDVWMAIRKKMRFFPSPAGLLNLEAEKFDWLRRLNPKCVNHKKHSILLNTLDVLRLDAFDKISSNTYLEATSDREVNNYLEGLKKFELLTLPNINQLTGTLRNYQEIGLQWLWFLYQENLSGLLCDDMGLGKTLQAIALMASALHYSNEKKATAKFLIVCPTSVIFHWQDKLKQFLPHVKLFKFYGQHRNLEDFALNHDILLTSYGIVRNEIEELEKIPFTIAIFDEIQTAKNHTSLSHKALLKINARMRIGLTGTPIENHLRELKALFDLVLPSYMPTEKNFRDYFVKPIEKENNEERKDILSRFVKPFILRRQKKDVLTDLPSKIEEVAHCELLPSQQELYLDVLHQRQQSLLRELERENSPIPYMHIFALLSALKQICNHPAAYLKQPKNYKNYDSGKWKLFLELLTEARESKQKVVVFSHYLAMLDIMTLYLNEQNINFASIRGATIKRGEEVHRFNNDPNCEVFLGSLHAAGVGIDLTAASVVIHYDRWWNAAKENQATDRIHRIGQTRGVQVFKLVTLGTFEEKIDEIITQKSKLLEDIIAPDNHDVLKLFDRQELIQLIQFVGSQTQNLPQDL